jgi:hypothetical protein
MRAVVGTTRESDSTCSGHIYERRQAGYGWFGGPR